jgi:hypothetical protein
MSGLEADASAAENCIAGSSLNVGVWTKADSVTLFDDFTCGER